MEDDTRAQWTIEPKLQEFIDRKMVIARATFAKETDEKGTKKHDAAVLCRHGPRKG
jgi:hypothetical protein